MLLEGRERRPMAEQCATLQEDAQRTSQDGESERYQEITRSADRSWGGWRWDTDDASKRASKHQPVNTGNMESLSRAAGRPVKLGECLLHVPQLSTCGRRVIGQD